MVELWIQHNNLGRKRSAQRNQEEGVEDSNLSETEEEVDDNDNNLSIKIQGTHMKGALEDVKTHPLMNLFKVPIDNNNTLHCFHFEISQVLKNKDNAAEFLILLTMPR